MLESGNPLRRGGGAPNTAPGGPPGRQWHCRPGGREGPVAHRAVQRARRGTSGTGPHHVYDDLAFMTAGPSGGKAGPPSDRFIRVQESHIPNPANTKTT